MSEKPEKIVIIATHGADDPERATFPFILANSARLMDVEVTVILQGFGVLLANKGCYEHVFAVGLPSLKEQVDTFIEQGGKLLVCDPCIRERKIEESMLVPTAEPIASARAVEECLEATSVITY